MPSDPDKKIEPLLQAYAEKRREAAGPAKEMHPATRRLLQSEIRKRWPTAMAERPRKWHQAIASLWSRLAVAGAITAVLGLSIWLMFSGSEQRHYASAPSDVEKEKSFPKQGAMAGVESARMESAVPFRPQDPLDSSADHSGKREDSTEPKDVGLKADLPSPGSREVPVRLYAADEKDKASSPNRSAPAARSISPRPSPTSSSVADRAPRPAGETETLSGGALPTRDQYTRKPMVAEPEVGGVGLTQTAKAVSIVPSRTSPQTESPGPNQQTRFRNLRPLALAGPAITTGPGPAQRFARTASAITNTAAVLANFALEQNGSNIRIVDGDGSIYEGRLVSGVETAADFAAPNRLADDLARRVQVQPLVVVSPDKTIQTARGASSAPSSYNFEVAGTNETLQQRVFFAGTLVVTATNSLEASVARNLAKAPALMPTEGVANPTSVSFGAVSNQALGQQVLRIVGRGRFGGTNEVQVDAVPASR